MSAVGYVVVCIGFGWFGWWLDVCKGVRVPYVYYALGFAGGFICGAIAI